MPWAKTSLARVMVPVPVQRNCSKWLDPGTLPGVEKVSVGEAPMKTVRCVPELWKASALVVALWVKLPAICSSPALSELSSLPPSKTALP